ncbi:MAG: undecaprenyl-diphosphate phosphatase [Bacteroides sp.]|nr:undecaprenyl-diphosphate phosphatase [Ruminococcus flavefaciens]MCM1555364.1 undecaprenyl-diphosphate phosphatase [Bacteroides sp.]
MGWFEALILGIIQGLTEFLPVSSSGHLEIGKALLGVEATDDLLFTVVVHGATVLSTIVVFWKEILKLCKGLFRFELNAETIYVFKLLLSMIPILVVGVFFKDRVEALFGSGLMLVGCMLLLTALLLTLANYLGSGKREISFRDAFVIGLAQCVAVLPGLSRSGTTIATGLLLGNKKEAVAQFSFLMVLIPILGENILSLASGEISASTIPLSSLLIGFCSAFVSGWAACRFMLRIVKGKKLVYFAVYCLVVGILAIIL